MHRAHRQPRVLRAHRLHPGWPVAVAVHIGHPERQPCTVRQPHREPHAALESLADPGPCTWVPLAISDSEIWCTSGTGGTAVGDTNVTLDRVNIHGCENGFDADQWVTVQNSWIHDLLGDVGHTDGLQMAHYLNGCATSACEVSHARFVDVIHNRIEAIAGTSAIISNPSGDSDVTIRGNLLTGGAYTLYCPYSGVAGPNWFARDNRFIRTSSRPNGGEFGPWTGCEDEVPANVTGNVWDDNNAPLN
jgi:hypothetical protein